MRSRLRSARRDEAGLATTVALIVLAVMAVFAMTVFKQSLFLGNDAIKHNNTQRAFDAADAGLEMAVRRLTFLQPAPTSCVTTQVASPQAGGWCAQTPEESLGRGETFTYRVSVAPSPGGVCAGAAPPTGTFDRCIVAIGRANGVEQRLETRVAMRGGQFDPIFYMGATFGREQVRIESDATVESDITTNGRFEVKKNVTVTGDIFLGPNAPKPRGWPGTYQRMTTNAFAANPEFGNTATVNSNSLLPPSMYNAATRTLTVPQNGQVTLSPGNYNFCQIVFKGRSIVNTAGSTAEPVRIFLDSPERPGSGCPAKTGSLTAGGKSGFSNPSLDPTAFQLLAWGTTGKKAKSKLTIPLGKKGTLAVAIVAPNSEIRFKDAGVLIGGIAGRKIIFKKKMRFMADTRMSSFTLTTEPTMYRLAWRQCRSKQDPLDPVIGC